MDRISRLKVTVLCINKRCIDAVAVVFVAKYEQLNESSLLFGVCRCGRVVGVAVSQSIRVIGLLGKNKERAAVTADNAQRVVRIERVNVSFTWTADGTREGIPQAACGTIRFGPILVAARRRKPVESVR